MIDLRPVGYLMGWLLAGLGASMALPVLADVVAGHENARTFVSTGVLTVLCGATMALACANADRSHMSVQQSFLLATSIWAVFPLFGAIPFMFGTPHVSFTDAYFEAMSAISTTGATVFTGLDDMPPGVLLWRGMLQWFGGLGIIVLALVFLPALKVGGMQLFKSEAFDTLGKLLPRAGQIAYSLISIYLFLTFLCFMAYVYAGMVPFDALVHSMTTIATGGMANTDASFSGYNAAIHYCSFFFMALAALPFMRYIQLVAGDAEPILHDSQIRVFLAIILGGSLTMALYVTFRTGAFEEQVFREALFNVTSILTGTGYASADYGTWGPLAVTGFFVLGLIGGCSGSTACSVKVFRYQLLFSAISAELKRLNSPHRVFMPRYQGQRVSDDIMDSVIAFFMFFYLTLAIVAVLLILLGLEPITAISGAATALANIGPGLGEEIGPSGNFRDLSDAAKWVLAVTMLIGRLELMSVFVLFQAKFWQA